MDTLDYVEEQQSFLHQLRIDSARKHKRLPATGSCYYCREPLDKALFCDADCRDDYEKTQKAQQRNGRGGV